jgi:hypothetical protein
MSEGLKLMVLGEMVAVNPVVALSVRLMLSEVP